MRTLKKSLALVLALVMVLGLGVVGASADNKLDSYTDAGEIGDAYVEAVGVLTGLGIVDGRTDTEIVPEATYNRAEAAKIIAYMLLGKDQADALKATVAPFEDVSVDFWAAGYIAYCAELGIISGMTETTFEPYGTLTGYQWAKMLLVAVGYGKNGEFEGDSWSLNTATVVAKTGLNEGDLEAADHVALRREQAMLFAFNALNLKQVTYSPNSTNYVYDIWGYVFADGTGTTLGEEVYDLAMVEGQIIDNEAMGNANTVVDPVNKWARNVEIDANTGLDLMYHAVRVWYVDGKTNTNVYVTDLAETTVYECMNMAAGKKAFDKLSGTKGTETIGTGTAYETYLIDNRELDLGYEYVTLNANFGKLGYAGKTNTTIGGNSVKNTLILTDISEIEYGDNIVYVSASSTQDSSDKAWHVWATTTTSGAIKDIKQSDGKVISITLSDDTVLEMSSFWNDYGTIPNWEVAIGRTYNYVLDTHGDVILATANYARELYAYTGEWKATGEYGDINTDQGREYRFINVSNGEERWAPIYGGGWTLAWGTYYDLSASTTSKGFYVATPVYAISNPYTEHFAIGHFVLNAKDYSTSYFTFDNGDFEEDIYFNNSEIVFYIAEGYGKNMKVTPITGFAALKDKLGVAANGKVELDNACFTVVDNYSGTAKYATSCFVFLEDISTESGYVFIPKDVPAANWGTVSGDPLGYTVSYDGAWLEGEEVTVSFSDRVVDGIVDGNGNVLTRGFYTISTFYLDRDGDVVYVLDKKVANGAGELCFYQNVIGDAIDTTGDTWKFNGYLTDADTKVIQFTDETDAVTLRELFQMTVDGYKFSYAFTVDPNDGKVDYVYAVNNGWLNDVAVSVDDGLKALGWTASGELDDVDENLDTAHEFDVTLTNSDVAKKLTVGATYPVKYTVTRLDNDGDVVTANKEATATVQADGTLKFKATVWPQEYQQTIKVQVTDIVVKLEISLYGDSAYNNAKTGVDAIVLDLGATCTWTTERNAELSNTEYRNGHIQTKWNDENSAVNPFWIWGTLSEYDTVTVKLTPYDANTHLWFFGVESNVK